MYVLLPFTFPRIASPCTFDTHHLLLHYLPCTHSTSPQVICQYFPSRFFCFFRAKRPPFGWPHHNAAGRQASLTVLLYFFQFIGRKTGCCCHHIRSKFHRDHISRDRTLCIRFTAIIAILFTDLLAFFSRKLFK